MYGIKSVLGDHYLWSDHKKGTESLPSSQQQAEIMRCKLHGVNLSWRSTRFKLVAYESKLLGCNNVRFNILDKELKEMLNIQTSPDLEMDACLKRIK